MSCWPHSWLQEDSTTYSLKCNISIDVNYLHQGISLGLVEDREKNSAQLDKLVLFKGTAKVTQLPPYLAVQMVRFFYKAEVQQKAKILRKVGASSSLASRCVVLAAVPSLGWLSACCHDEVGPRAPAAALGAVQHIYHSASFICTCLLCSHWVWDPSRGCLISLAVQARDQSCQADEGTHRSGP